MKKIYVFLVFILLCFSLYSQGDKKRVGVLDFVGKGVSKTEAEIVGELFRGELVNSGMYNVLDRANMDNILSEMEFQQTGCTESECAIQIGKILNMQYMFYGSLMKLGESYIVSVGIVNVETSEIEKTAKEKFAVIDNADVASRAVIDILAGRREETTAKVSQAPSQLYQQYTQPSSPPNNSVFLNKMEYEIRAILDKDRKLEQGEKLKELSAPLDNPRKKSIYDTYYIKPFMPIALNLIPVFGGIGSFYQKDIRGGTVLMLLGIGGGANAIVGSAMTFGFNAPIGPAVLVSGVAMVATQIIVGGIRPFIFAKKYRKYILEGLNTTENEMAFIPSLNIMVDEDGNIAYNSALNIKF